MAASEAADDRLGSCADFIEEVAFDRNKPKLRYQGYMFRNVSSNGSRYRWRCTVAKCGARLETDKYGDRHLKYLNEPHDQEAHMEATPGKKRRNKMYQRKVIGGFTYVLENIIGEHAQACWRCEIIGCHGRCRTTYDFVLVAGPSEHSCRESQDATNVDLSSRTSQGNISSTDGESSRNSAGQSMSVGTGQGTTASIGEDIASKQEADLDVMYYPQVILNERSSPLQSAGASCAHGGVFGDCDCGRTPPAPTEIRRGARPGPSWKLVLSEGEKVAESGSSHRNFDSSVVPGPSQPKVQAYRDDRTAQEPEVIDLQESSDDDICEEEQTSVSVGYEDHSDESNGQDSSSEREKLETELLEADLNIQILKRKLIERKLQSLARRKRRASKLAPSTNGDA